MHLICQIRLCSRFFLKLTLSSSSGQLHWSRNPSQLNQAEQNRTWQFHLWNRGLLRLQSWLLSVRLVCAYMPAYRLLGQALTRVHWWVNSFIFHHLRLHLCFLSLSFLSLSFSSSPKPLWRKPWSKAWSLVFLWPFCWEFKFPHTVRIIFAIFKDFLQSRQAHGYDS